MGTDLAYNFVFKGKFESVDWRSDLISDSFYGLNDNNNNL